MGLKWLSHLLAVLLFASLTTLIALFVLNHTLLSSHYIEAQLSQEHAYVKLSTAISDELATTGGVTTPQLATQLQSIITPALLQQRVNSALDQLQVYYQGKGPAPRIDISDLVAQAQAAGLPVSVDGDLDKPIVLGSTAHTQALGTRTHTLWQRDLAAAVLFLLALGAVSWRRHRYAVFGSILIALGILYGLLAAALLLLPDLIDKHLKMNFNVNAFAGVGHSLAVALAHALGKDFAIVAAVCLVLGIPARVWIGRIKSNSVTKPKTKLRSQPAKIS